MPGGFRNIETTYGMEEIRLGLKFSWKFFFLSRNIKFRDFAIKYPIILYVVSHVNYLINRMLINPTLSYSILLEKLLYPGGIVD